LVISRIHLSLFFLHCARAHPRLPSFPTRRSSDLAELAPGKLELLAVRPEAEAERVAVLGDQRIEKRLRGLGLHRPHALDDGVVRSEEHTSELQSRENLVCRLLLEKKNTTSKPPIT